MDNDIIIGIDLAKNVFQLHGARRDGTVLFRKKLTRIQLKKFLSTHAPCLVAMEGVCSGWGRNPTLRGFSAFSTTCIRL
jgi:transposase